ncbi:MAG: hypothetical protein MSH18_03750 [Bacteroidales bacterium]|nr:hypothetical protein [Bacteroidales bacterium]
MAESNVREYILSCPEERGISVSVRINKYDVVDFFLSAQVSPLDRSIEENINIEIDYQQAVDLRDSLNKAIIRMRKIFTKEELEAGVSYLI